MEMTEGPQTNSPTTDSSADSRDSHANRLKADMNRAVGGPLNFLRELSRVSHRMDETVPAEWMVKRVQFFAYELQVLIRPGSPERDRLVELNRFFFDAKRFQCIAEPLRLAQPSAAYALNRVLATRSGAATVLAMIYSYLAERIGLTLEFVDLKPTCFLKWNDGGRSRFIDIIRGGSTLSSDELIEMLQTRFQMTTFCNTSLLETYSFETYWTEYLADFRTSCLPDCDPEKLLFLQNTLIAYQPSNLQLLGERALLHRRLGNFKSALADLKRYFAFHERDKAPPELVRLHEELVQLLDRQKTSIEVID